MPGIDAKIGRREKKRRTAHAATPARLGSRCLAIPVSFSPCRPFHSRKEIAAAPFFFFPTRKRHTFRTAHALAVQPTHAAERGYAGRRRGCPGHTAAQERLARGRVAVFIGYCGSRWGRREPSPGRCQQGSRSIACRPPAARDVACQCGTRRQGPHHQLRESLHPGGGAPSLAEDPTGNRNADLDFCALPRPACALTHSTSPQSPMLLFPPRATAISATSTSPSSSSSRRRCCCV